MREKQQSSIRWASAGLVLSVVLIVVKLVGYWITGSAAVLADALESCVHIVTSSFALYAVWLSAQPRDHNHPYGHGKVEYLSAGLEGFLVTGTGVAVIGISIQRFLVPVELPDAGLGALFELVAAALALLGGTAIVSAGRRNHSPTLEADGIHIRSDSFTSFAGFVGVGLVALTGKVWIDPLVAGLLGLYLVYTGVGVVRGAVGGIMDEADLSLLERIVNLLKEVRAPGWLSPHNLKVHQLGQAFHVDLHVVFPRYWELEKAHEECHRFNDAVSEAFEGRAECMVHAEPCADAHCPQCDVVDCPIRKAPFVALQGWTVEDAARRHTGISSSRSGRRRALRAQEGSALRAQEGSASRAREDGGEKT